MKINRLPSSPPFGLSEADIQNCAYFLWKKEGCPAGRDLELWLTAKELLRHRAAVAGCASRKNCAPMAKKRGAARPLLR